MPGEEICDWPKDVHPLDIRPLAGESRERMYERAAAARLARTPARLPPDGTLGLPRTPFRARPGRAGDTG